MYNLVLLLMGIVFISFKNNKKILLKNIFIEKDDLNSKKQCGIITSLLNIELLSSICSSLLNPTPSPLASRGRAVGGSSWPSRRKPCAREVWHTHTWLVLCCLVLWPACPLQRQSSVLAVPSGPGLAALVLAWRILLSKELPLQVQIRSLNE